MYIYYVLSVSTWQIGHLLLYYCYIAKACKLAERHTN